jgi:proline iminopeptidase
MQKFFLALFVVVAVSAAHSAAAQKIDGLYVNTFGDASKQALIFVHGGPGYNSWDFELTTAPVLAKEGFYVVVYDERGQGRSEEVELAQFNYKQYATDLKKIIDQLGLKKPVLLGHSHGGPISIKFEEQFPGIAKSIVLVSAPIDFWGSMRNIFSNCAQRYEQTQNTKKLDELTFIYYGLFASSDVPADQIPGYVSAAFGHGMQCGLYNTKSPTVEALAFSELKRKNPLKGPLSGTTTAVTGFVKNENYVHFNMLDFVATNRSRFCGIYGNEDGLFSPIDLSLIRNIIEREGEPKRMQVIQGASHALYTDQQSAFIGALKGTCNLKP